MRLRLLLVCCLTAISALVVPSAQAAKAPVVIDFSTVGVTSGSLDPLFFKDQGVRFADTLYLSPTYGDVAAEFVTTPFTPTFSPPVSGITVSLALIGPDVGGHTADFTLTAYSGSGHVVGSITAPITQGGTVDQPMGFETISLSDLSGKAKSFSLTTVGVYFAVNWFSYTYE
jgi:hypothetical protein